MTYPTKEWAKERLKSITNILNGLREQSLDLHNLIDQHEDEKELLESLLKHKFVR